MIEHTIYKEFIDKISELSDGIYPIITDLDNDLSYVPDKTADFFGFEAGEHTCFFEQLSSCVNYVDLPEYKQEIRYRLNGEKPDDIFYVRMGKHTKEYMMGSQPWRGGLDLFHIVMIGIGKDLPGQEENYELHRFLGTIFSQKLAVEEKLHIMNTEYDM